MPSRAEPEQPFVVSEQPSASVGAAGDDLRTTPFAHLLVELLVAQSSGTLFIRDAKQAPQAAIGFESGMPVAVVLEHAVDINELSAALIPLCAWAEGRFVFAEGHALESDRAIVSASPLDPLLLLTAAARGPLREDAVDQAIGVIGRNLLELNPQIDLDRYGFTGRESAVIESLELGAVDLEQLRALAAVPERVLRRVIYILRLTGALTLTPPVRRFSGTVTQPDLSQLDEPDWTVSQPRLRPSGMSRVRRTPPPRLFRSGAGSAGRYSVREPDHGMTALEVPDVEPASIAPEPRPSEPRVAMPVPPPSPALARDREPVKAESRARAAQAAVLWDRAEAALRRRDPSGALLCARDAIKVGTPSAEQEALLAWALYQNSGAGARIHPKVFEHLDHALRTDPLCESAHYYKGLLFKQKGLLDRAHAHFQRVLLLNSGHVDAAREVHLYERRRSQNSQPPGLLRRWLKRER
jgi:tetratricopeptide (TPR) repeat protein